MSDLFRNLIDQIQGIEVPFDSRTGNMKYSHSPISNLSYRRSRFLNQADLRTADPVPLSPDQVHTQTGITEIKFYNFATTRTSYDKVQI